MTLLVEWTSRALAIASSTTAPHHHQQGSFMTRRVVVTLNNLGLFVDIHIELQPDHQLFLA